MMLGLWRCEFCRCLPTFRRNFSRMCPLLIFEMIKLPVRLKLSLQLSYPLAQGEFKTRNSEIIYTAHLSSNTLLHEAGEKEIQNDILI